MVTGSPPAAGSASVDTGCAGACVAGEAHAARSIDAATRSDKISHDTLFLFIFTSPYFNMLMDWIDNRAVRLEIEFRIDKDRLLSFGFLNLQPDTVLIIPAGKWFP